ncbi:MAG: stage sporulation protein [Bacillota bacterium]|jgi:stage II sporulation protein D|nr:stage sporulation protein [Bacillota bacterium]MDK2925713.1 stage sporulation protein [Bacillota bacterium]
MGKFLGRLGLALFLAASLLAERVDAATPTYLKVKVFSTPDAVTVGARSSFAFFDPSGRRIAEFPSTSTVKLTRDGNQVVLPGGVRQERVRVIASGNEGNGLVLVMGRPYRGELEVWAASGWLIVVNVVSIEDYLRGVVPAEMPPTWPEEALKAQAVVARTFAYKNRGRHAAEGYDLCATQHCQVYGGAVVERAASDRAVKETAGLVLRYQGQLIDAYYHASSGGRTEAAGAVWGTERPYLKGIEDEWDRTGPYAEWKVSFTLEEIAALLEKAGFPVGRLEDIRPLAYLPSGRVGSFLVRGSGGEWTLPGEKLRQVLGTTVLKSTWVEVEKVSAGTQEGVLAVVQGASSQGKKLIPHGARIITAEGISTVGRRSGSSSPTPSRGSRPDQVVFRGRGYGHGVGMSQWGARRMAENHPGPDPEFFRQILTYYYQGVTIEPY